MLSPLLIFILCSAFAHAHLAAWTKGMYCKNGPQTADDENASAPTTPLFNLPKSQWWFHAVDQCNQFPPPDGEFLEIPAGQSFTVEISANRATTTLSYNGIYASDWVDGEAHTDAFRGSTTCITDPNIHTQNETMAAGTAFAIAYSDMSQVTEDNLAVFSVRYHTPWKRLTSYDVPAALPACPPGGCICAWGWVPNGCGQPNIYHQGFKCKVTGATSTNAVATAKPPVWCEDNPSKCVQGAKQMIYWNQAEGNNIQVSGNDLSGNPKSPAYNQKLGFADGAQNDIFVASGQGSSSSTVASPASTTSASHPANTPASVPSAGATVSSSIAAPASTSTTVKATSENNTASHHGTCSKPPHHRRSSLKKRGLAMHRRRNQSW
ncbi:hypothetical protein H0H93_000622 [Arthromyces matolae]|nr:hypothetical protein H0H93_000622 [Arthromyces matolae]